MLGGHWGKHRGPRGNGSHLGPIRGLTGFQEEVTSKPKCEGAELASERDTHEVSGPCPALCPAPSLPKRANRDIPSPKGIRGWPRHWEAGEAWDSAPGHFLLLKLEAPDP